ncbi:MAG: ATP-grasp domain-containing protein, partial [Candidatus Hodarchaeota archaeon]
VIKALRMGSQSLHIIGVDTDSNAPSFYLKNKQYLLEKIYVTPNVENPDYIPKIIEICKTENVNVVFPCTDPELETLSASIDEIINSGIKVIICPSKTITICRDKWVTYKQLSFHLPIAKSALPETGIEEALKFTGLPAIIKPRRGWGSRQIAKVGSVEEARILLTRISAPVIQTCLTGSEYTIDCLADTNGKIMCIVPRHRIKIIGGLSFQGVTVRDEELIELGKKVAKSLKFIGPFNFQVIKNDEETYITEVNPRFSGTGILSVMAGANIPYLALREICNMRIPSQIDFEEGLFLSRYFEETYIKSKK